MVFNPRRLEPETDDSETRQLKAGEGKWKDCIKKKGNCDKLIEKGDRRKENGKIV